MTRKQREKRSRIIGLVSVCAALLLAGGFILWANRGEKAEFTATAPTTTTAIPSTVPLPTASADPELNITPSVLPFYQQNPDTVGYIRIQNTRVDYPVVYSGDNEFYLTNGFDKEPAESGAIFMDFRCDINDFDKTRNIILYGHRMRDGSMFKSLTNYQSKTFFCENPRIQFDTLNQQLNWEIFAVFITRTDFYYIDTDFPEDEKWMDFLAECKSRSMYETDVNFYPTDIILTLSTCAANVDKRLVVMARLKR